MCFCSFIVKVIPVLRLTDFVCGGRTAQRLFRTESNLAHETLCFAVRRGYALGYVLKGFRLLL